jgi:hypothetical protein
VRITFFLTSADAMGGTAAALLTQARALNPWHDVRVISLHRTADQGHFTSDDLDITYLVDTRTDQQPLIPGVAAPDEVASLAATPGSIVDPIWEPRITALSERAAAVALGALETDILIVGTPPTLALAAELAPPSVIIIHEEHKPPETRNETLIPVLHYGPQVDAVVLLTERSRSWLESAMGERKPVLAAIGNAIPDLFRPRSSLTNPLVVTAGRFVGQKRFDHLIAAFRTVVDEFPEWRLRIYGDGPTEDGLRRLIRRRGLGGNVELPGRVTSIAHEWAKGSIFALSSRVEGLPLAAQEACAAGLPIVAYDCPTGPAEIIDGGRNGILVPLGDIDGLAEAMLALIRDPQELRRLGDNAYASTQRYAPATIRSQWESLFADLIATREATGPASTRQSRAHFRNRGLTATTSDVTPS